MKVLRSVGLLGSVLISTVYLVSCGGDSNDSIQALRLEQSLSITLRPDGENNVLIDVAKASDPNQKTRVVIDDIGNAASTLIELHDLLGTTLYSGFLASDLPMVLPANLDDTADSSYEIRFKNIDAIEAAQFDLTITGAPDDEGTRDARLAIDLSATNTFQGKVENASYYILTVPNPGTYELQFTFEAKTRLQFGAFDPVRFGTFGVSCSYYDSPSFDCAVADITADSAQQIALDVVHLEQPAGVFSAEFSVSVRLQP